MNSWQLIRLRFVEHCHPGSTGYFAALAKAGLVFSELQAQGKLTDSTEAGQAFNADTELTTALSMYGGMKQLGLLR